eukprot:g1747.t1
MRRWKHARRLSALIITSPSDGKLNALLRFSREDITKSYAASHKFDVFCGFIGNLTPPLPPPIFTLDFTRGENGVV